MTTNRFSVPLAALAEKVKLDIDTVARKATLDLFSSVVQRSPVDTGRFKGNWNYSQNTLDASTTDGANQARGLTEAGKAAAIDRKSVV